MPAHPLLDWIALNLLPGLGPILVRRALERFCGPAEIAYRVPATALASVPGLGPATAAAIVEARRALRRKAERELKQANKLGVRLTVHDDPDYPAALAELSDPPILLYVRGELPPAVVRVAVVGSRQATLYGQRVATGLASGLAVHDIEVVSGGARGIDTCAHRGALEEGGRTVAVLGSGFLRPYPEENAGLFDRIAENGALVTEFPLDQGPRPESFPRRNRLISGLSAAVVVVEANKRSGSLSTAGHALEQGREVLAVPGPVSSARSEGCNRLIQQGAKLIQTIDDLLQELSPMYREAVTDDPEQSRAAANGPPATHASDLPDDERAILALLDEVEPVQVDDLADRAPFGFARLQAALFGLEVRGAVDSLPGGHYQRRPGRSGN